MDICFWEEVDNGDYYESECNKKGFQFNDGSPYDNGFNFCPYCGKQLKIKKPNDEEVAMFNCPQCGEETETLHEGYCDECRDERQNELNEYNARNAEDEVYYLW